MKIIFRLAFITVLCWQAWLVHQSRVEVEMKQRQLDDVVALASDTVERMCSVATAQGDAPRLIPKCSLPQTPSLPRTTVDITEN
jgi:hypothetical protein